MLNNSWQLQSDYIVMHPQRISHACCFPSLEKAAGVDPTAKLSVASFASY
jgi:hypothetical protein